MTEKRPKN